MLDDANLQSSHEIVQLRATLDKVRKDHKTEIAGFLAGAERLRMLEEALETVPVGVVIADASGRIIQGNGLVEQIVGHPVLYSDDVNSYGEWVSFHLDGRRVESHEYPLSRVLRDGKDFSSIDVNYQRGDGTLCWIRIIGRPVRDDLGNTIGASVAVIDISKEREHLETQQILIGELNHRVKNAFSVVKSIVSQSLRNVDVDKELRNTVDRRLDAYAQAHARLIGGTWEQADVRDVAHDILGKIADGRITIEGPSVAVPLRHGLALSMAFYELATNAWKHGALSVPDGRIDLSWNAHRGEAPPELELTWREHGGPVISPPKRKGFGSLIIQRALITETRGRVKIDYPSEGLCWNARLPIEREVVCARS